MVPTRIRIARIAFISQGTKGQCRQKALRRKARKLIASVASLLVIAHVDDGLLELPSRNLAVEQNVKLAVGAVLKLGQEEVGHDPADEGGAAPDVAALASHVPAGGVKHLGGKVDHGYLGNLEKSVRICPHLSNWMGELT